VIDVVDEDRGGGVGGGQCGRGGAVEGVRNPKKKKKFKWRDRR
jgi:hypothetical protein